MIRAHIFAAFVVSTLAITSCGTQSTDIAMETEHETQAQDQTTKDLEYALAGECQANRKYTAFAEIADQQGHPQVARLWRAAAAAEAIHARNHMKELGMLKSTEQNLEGAVEGEQYEFTTMYPRFIKTAEDAGKQGAARSMEWAFKVEQLHHKMFQRDLDDLKSGQRPPNVAYWVCSTCGNTVPEKAPEICPICGSPKNKFFEVK